jgi:ribonuclease BN (tRNA processing enzyme)
MQSQIIFLGTAGDSFVLAKQQRIAGGILIQTQGMQFHCNPGPGAFVAAQQYATVRETTAVIVTDNSFVHSHDAPAIVDAMTLGGFDAKGLLLVSKSALPVFSQKYQNAVEKVVVLQEEAKIECNAVQIEAVKIKNKDPDTVGVKITTPEFSLGYLGKTRYSPRINESVKDVEILILELTSILESKEGLCVAEAQQLIQEIKPQLAVLTGFGIDVLKEDILELTRRMCRATGQQIIAAKDGFSFDPTSYAVKLRQQRLQF